MCVCKYKEKHFNLIKTLPTVNVGKLSFCDSPSLLYPLFKIYSLYIERIVLKTAPIDYLEVECNLIYDLLDQ